MKKFYILFSFFIFLVGFGVLVNPSDSQAYYYSYSSGPYYGGTGYGMPYYNYYSPYSGYSNYSYSIYNNPSSYRNQYDNMNYDYYRPLSYNYGGNYNYNNYSNYNYNYNSNYSNYNYDRYNNGYDNYNNNYSSGCTSYYCDYY